MPASIPPGTLLPDDFVTGAARFSDDIVAWAAGAAAPTAIYRGGAIPIDARELTVSSDNKKIRFVNRYDKKLYEVPVKPAP